MLIKKFKEYEKDNLWICALQVEYLSISPLEFENSFDKNKPSPIVRIYVEEKAFSVSTSQGIELEKGSNVLITAPFIHKEKTFELIKKWIKTT